MVNLSPLISHHDEPFTTSFVTEAFTTSFVIMTNSYNLLESRSKRGCDSDKTTILPQKDIPFLIRVCLDCGFEIGIQKYNSSFNYVGIGIDQNLNLKRNREFEYKIKIIDSYLIQLFGKINLDSIDYN